MPGSVGRGPSQDWGKKIGDLETLSKGLDSTFLARVDKKWAGRTVTDFDYLAKTFETLIARFRDFVTGKENRISLAQELHGLVADFSRTIKHIKPDSEHPDKDKSLREGFNNNLKKMTTILGSIEKSPGALEELDNLYKDIQKLSTTLTEAIKKDEEHLAKAAQQVMGSKKGWQAGYTLQDFPPEIQKQLFSTEEDARKALSGKSKCMALYQDSDGKITLLFTLGQKMGKVSDIFERVGNILKGTFEPHNDGKYKFVSAETRAGAAITAEGVQQKAQVSLDKLGQSLQRMDDGLKKLEAIVEQEAAKKHLEKVGESLHRVDSLRDQLEGLVEKPELPTRSEVQEAKTEARESIDTLTESVDGLEKAVKNEEAKVIKKESSSLWGIIQAFFNAFGPGLE